MTVESEAAMKEVRNTDPDYSLLSHQPLSPNDPQLLPESREASHERRLALWKAKYLPDRYPGHHFSRVLKFNTVVLIRGTLNKCMAL